VDLLLAVLPYSPAVAGAYIRALSYFWTANNSTGLPDDPPLLQRISGCDDAEWLVVRPIVFGKLFFKDGKALWQPTYNGYRLPDRRRCPHHRASPTQSKRRLADLGAFFSA
jgi:hypothetical protein